MREKTPLEKFVDAVEAAPFDTILNIMTRLMAGYSQSEALPDYISAQLRMAHLRQIVEIVAFCQQHQADVQILAGNGGLHNAQACYPEPISGDQGPIIVTDANRDSTDEGRRLTDALDSAADPGYSMSSWYLTIQLHGITYHLMDDRLAGPAETEYIGWDELTKALTE